MLNIVSCAYLPTVFSSLVKYLIDLLRIFVSFIIQFLEFLSILETSAYHIRALVVSFLSVWLLCLSRSIHPVFFKYTICILFYFILGILLLVLNLKNTLLPLRAQRFSSRNFCEVYTFKSLRLLYTYIYMYVLCLFCPCFTSWLSEQFGSYLCIPFPSTFINSMKT